MPTLDTSYLPLLISQIDEHMPCVYEVLVQKEKGFLNAVLCGLNRAKGDVIVIIDSDGSHNPAYLPKMIRMLDNADIVLGSRYIEGAESGDVFLRRFLSRMYCLVGRSMLRIKVADIMSGFIVMKRGVLGKVRLNSLGYKVGLSILMQAKEFKVAECPIVMKKSQIGTYVKSRNLLDGIKTLLFIFRLAIQRLAE